MNVTETRITTIILSLIRSKVLIIVTSYHYSRDVITLLTIVDIVVSVVVISESFNKPIISCLTVLVKLLQVGFKRRMF